jgi:hypothetical protein
MGRKLLFQLAIPRFELIEALEQSGVLESDLLLFEQRCALGLRLPGAPMLIEQIEGLDQRLAVDVLELADLAGGGELSLDVFKKTGRVPACLRRRRPAFG